MSNPSTLKSTTLVSTIAIVGAGGFVGQCLIKYLLDNTTLEIIAISRSTDKIKITDERLKIYQSDINSWQEVPEFLKAVPVVFYLVHQLSEAVTNIYQAEETVTNRFAKLAKQAGVRRVIYLGGLGDDNERLSRHLNSRHHTGDVLRSALPEVLEFRAGLIVGPGSISFSIVEHLINKWPIIVLPKAALTKMQPIGYLDVMRYLTAGINVPLKEHAIVDIGAPEVFSYQEFLKFYSEKTKRRRLILIAPFLPLAIAAVMLRLVLPRDLAQVGSNMVESFKNEMIVKNKRAGEMFPNIIPMEIGLNI